MIWTFLGAYIILGILVYVMFKILKSSVSKIDEESKTYYLEKLSKYDDIINEKELKLKTLNEEIKNKREEISNIKNVKFSSNEEFDMGIIDSINKTSYKDKNLFELEKFVSEKWNYDEEKIINEFIKKSNSSMKNYDFCKNLRRKFNNKNLYDFKILSNKELDKKLKEILDDKESSLLDAYKKTHEFFSIDEFLVYLDELVIINNPEITVYTGSKSDNYDYMDKYVKTKYDSSIYKGIKVLYQGKIYDFSLNGRNL